jgi:hypothetical protein
MTGHPTQARRLFRESRIRRCMLALVVLGLGPGPARGDETDVQAELGRLRARVSELEAENARLRNDAGLAATLGAAADATVRTSFDADTDTTTIATTPSRLVRTDGGSVRQWLTLQAQHHGRVRPPSAGDALLLLETSASAGDYRGATALRLVVDGTSAECPVVRYASEPIVAGRMAVPAGERETVTVSLPASVLARMAEGREVRAALGRNEFALTAEQLATVRAFKKRLAD